MSLRVLGRIQIHFKLSKEYVCVLQILLVKLPKLVVRRLEMKATLLLTPFPESNVLAEQTLEDLTFLLSRESVG